jgi:hypothetical protein
MALEQSKIKANAEKYFKTAFEGNFMSEGLMNFLGEDFIKAPASNLKEYCNSFEGGLIDYLLNVASYAIKINNSIPEESKVDKNSLLKVCLLHGIGKAKLYVPCTSEWHIKNQGKMYEFNGDLVSMRISERSVYYIVSNGIHLTENEYIAILNHDSNEESNLIAKNHNSMLGELLKMSIKLVLKTK